MKYRYLLLIAALRLSPLRFSATENAGNSSARVQSLKITILSTMLADGKELGEWGFSALVEADGNRILFDTGAHPDVVLKNAKTLGVDLANVPEVILSHSHWDHIGGLLTLRKSVSERSPAALATAHVAEGFFYSRSDGRPGVDRESALALKPEYERAGGTFVIHAQPVRLHPGVWLLGPIPRHYPERNWGGSGKVITPSGTVEDNVPEDTALVFDTDRGLVVLTGCGHAGVINTLEYAQKTVRPARIHALIGGLHLYAASDETLKWTAEKLRAFEVENLLGTHCTGIEALFRLRHDLGLERKHASVGAVGAGFELGHGIDPRAIAR
jgi:7,8-dihydropterin-6-yl-methyl-4-(beta-D-ribofuranosyl)aminobenzene 5'-phosphate synthase